MVFTLLCLIVKLFGILSLIHCCYYSRCFYHLLAMLLLSLFWLLFISIIWVVLQVLQILLPWAYKLTCNKSQRSFKYSFLRWLKAHKLHSLSYKLSLCSKTFSTFYIFLSLPLVFCWVLEVLLLLLFTFIAIILLLPL